MTKALKPEINNSSGSGTEYSSRVDIATSAIIRESLASIVREMRRSMVRSSYSSIIYEGYDFSGVLLDGDGNLIAESGEDHPFHVVPVAGAVKKALEIHTEINDDEMLLHNDPYTGGTHLNDIAVIQPVSINGSRSFYIVIRSHWGDVGGMSPGSLNGEATQILQEGLRLNYVKIPRFEHSEVMRFLFDNVRVTSEAISDFHSVLGTIKVAETRLRALCDKHGSTTIRDAMADILDISERRIRAAIMQIPDGDYHHVGYLDGNALTPHPLRVKVNLSIRGDCLLADFTGSSDQVDAPLNAGPAIAPTSVLTVIKSFLDPSGSITSGTLRAIDVELPSGSIVNANFPAPCGGLNEVRFACDAAIMGALARLIPNEITGDVRGTSNHTYIGTEDFIFYEYPSGGTGGWNGGDGNSAVRAFNEGENVSIQSTEVIESKFPLRILRSEIRPDSGGAGKFRGGVGLLREIEILTDRANLSVLSDRNIIPPAGVCGGLSGLPNRYTVLRDGEEISPGKFPGKIANFRLNISDVVRIETSGGGGWGDPNQRDSFTLEADLANGYISSDGISDYKAKPTIVTLARDPSISEYECLLSNNLADQSIFYPGNLVELVCAGGPSIRLWVKGIDPALTNDSICVAEGLTTESRMALVSLFGSSAFNTTDHSVTL